LVPFFLVDQPYDLNFCLECENRCDWGEQIEVHQCDSRDNAYWRFLNMGGGKTQFQLSGTNLCMELVGNRMIELRNCVSSSSAQKFGPGEGSFSGSRFELITPNDGCATMSHHPKSGEEIYRNSCTTARRNKTSFWNRL